MTLYARFAAHVNEVLDALEAEGALAPGLDRGAVAVEPPRDPAHGDLATNAAMVLAKRAGTNPRALAEAIAPKLAALDEVTGAEVAGPGLHQHPPRSRGLGRGARDDPRRGRRPMAARPWAQGRTVNVEYVSANPTGPMHMGHCRGAVVGDALASLLEYAGHKVIREYYVNDAGAQVDVLARSAHLRYLEALGRQIGEIPEGLYPGDYLKPVGDALAAEFGETYADAPESAWLETLPPQDGRGDARDDQGRSRRPRRPPRSLRLRARGAGIGRGRPRASLCSTERGWSTRARCRRPRARRSRIGSRPNCSCSARPQFGDDQDRPIRKSDGSWTYFAADTAYHMQKLERPTS